MVLSSVFLLVLFVFASLVFSPFTTVVEGLVGDNTCSSLQDGYNQMINDCDVASIEQMHHSSLYRGASNYCVASCVNAVDAFFTLAKGCGTADTVLSIEDVYSKTQLIYLQQSQCNAPSVECMTTSRLFSRWLVSSGSSCFSTLLASATFSNNTNAQDSLQALCTGSCRSGFVHYLSEFKQNGCEDWRAYTVFKNEFSSSCSQAEGLYCANQFNPIVSADAILTARDTTLDLSVRKDALDAICTPCFYEYIRTLRLESLNSGDLDDLEILCIQNENGYCYPQFTETLDVSSTVSPILRAQRLCQIGSCNEKMLSFIRAHPDAAPSVASTLTSTITHHLNYMCVANDINEICVNALAHVVSGFDNSFQFQGVPYHGPTGCEDISAGSYCTWGCQRRYTAQQDGCCHNTVRTYLALVGASDAELNSAFSSIETVADECYRPLADECPQQNITVEVDLSLPFPQRFLRNNEDAVVSDISVISGRSPSLFEIQSITSGDTSDTSTVVVVFGFVNSHQQTKFISSLNAAMSASNVVYSHVLPLYNIYVQSTDSNNIVI
eukprot:m.85888 g.85888  ORF g.85888 m.85888 type:complete len:553 (+) comp12202_c0_seq1:190-1848(+)